MTQSTDMVAAVFGPDQKALGQFLIEVPDGMDQGTLVEQVLALARVEGVLKPEHEGMVYVAMRPADPDDDEELYSRGGTETVH